MPVYPGRHRQGTWRIVLPNPHRGGKPLERTFAGKKSDAELYEARLKLDLQVQSKVESRAVPSFSTFCVREYEPHAVATLKASTWNKTRVYQVADLIRFFGPHRLDRLSDDLVDEYKDHCTEREFAPGYTNAMLIALRAILAWARKDCRHPVPELKIARVPMGKRRVRAWTLDEVRRLYRAAKELSPWFVSILHFLLDTGCRKGEAIAAQWSWVDWDAKLFRIPVTEEWQPKDKDFRDVPLSDGVFRMLQEHPRTGSSIFLSQYGTPYALFPHDAYWRARNAAGLTGGIHTTRHTFASHFLMAEPDLSLLAEVLGHSTTRTTELYKHLLPEHMNRARNAVQLTPPSPAWGEVASTSSAVTRGWAKRRAKTGQSGGEPAAE